MILFLVAVLSETPSIHLGFFQGPFRQSPDNNLLPPSSFLTMSELRFRRIRKKIPVGVRLLQWIGRDRKRMYRSSVFILTAFAYATFRLTRKTISVVKGTLSPACFPTRPIQVRENYGHDNNLTMLPSIHRGWYPFDTENGSQLLGSLDLAFLFSYAIGMFISGFIAEHVNIRNFLAISMVASGTCSILLGFGYFWNIHQFSFFVIIQIFFGFFQSSGWPCVVECFGNWFGKGRRGLIMGMWSSFSYAGNILGSAIPGIWASHEWGWSFIVPGIIIASMGIIIFLFLVVEPVHVGCTPPDQHPTPSADCVRKTQDFLNSSETEETDSLLNKSNSMRSSSESNGKIDESSPLLKAPIPGKCIAVSINSMEPSITFHAHGDACAIGFIKALLIPGVIEYSFCLFFTKLVSYTFLFWLPFYIENNLIGGKTYGAETSADLSIFFDFGGIVGAILAGLISDKTNCSGITVVVMLILGGPMLYIHRFLANSHLHLNILLMFLTGLLVNGPHSLITTAVSANLGTHECLKSNTKAMATVTAIISGNGSMGAALGPLLTGIIQPYGWNNVYYMLITADLLAALFLSRQVCFELKSFCLKRSRRASRTIAEVESAYHSLDDGETTQQ